jgi:glycosyltransferase A (GT-A) superfamily protein (DUF2064 family)
VVIGTDAPSFPTERLVEALELAVRGRIVVGPTEDGGYYLIALAEPAQAIFEGVAWGTGEVLEETRERAASTGARLEELPIWYDVDGAADLRRLRDELEGSGPGYRARHTAVWFRSHPGVVPR